MKKFLFILLVIVLAGISYLVFQNERTASHLRKPLDEPYLTELELAEVKEIYRVQRTFGNQVWPGFGETKIPVILYNDNFNFLFTDKQPSSQWENVSKENSQELSYYRRIEKNPQAFAVRVGNDWAGSLGTLRKTNKSYYLGLRSELPVVLKHLFPYQLATMPADFHVVAFIHEMFHAFQAKKYPEKFNKANFMYYAMKKYPYHDEIFIEQWNEEGKILFQALDSTEKEETIELLAQFIKLREKRRKGLKPEFIEFEKRVEWLEGLAKYVEMKTYELAAGKNREKGKYNYKEGLPYWQQEIARLKKLGELSMGDDFRFYLSGMAQARLLDELGVDWKDDAMGNNMFLDDILKNYLQKR